MFKIIFSGYLYYVTEAIVKNLEYQEGAQEIKMLKVITEPLTKAILELDAEVLNGWAINNASYDDCTLLKIWCGEEKCKYIYKNLETLEVNECKFQAPLCSHNWR